MHSRSTEDASLHKALTEERRKAWIAYTLIWLIGNERVVDAATRLLNIIDDVTWHKAEFDPEIWAEAVRGFVKSARADLLPNTSISASP
jgi:hypothetical protein